MNTANQPSLIRFDRETTFRLPCRETDLFLWLRSGLLSSGAGLVDFWYMHPGNHVTITNRFDDLPAGFALCTYEVLNSFAFHLLEWEKAGNQIPMDPVRGANIWRVLAGDRIVWIGHDRPEYKGIDGILSIFDFHKCALATGEAGRSSVENIHTFGSPPQELSEERSRQFIAAIEYVNKKGIPRVISAGEWRQG